MSTRSDLRRDQEMERGRIIAQRAERARDLDRLVAGQKVTVMVALHGHAYYEPKGQVNIFHVAGMSVAHQNVIEDDYPSENVMATVLLAVGATVGTDGVPPVMSDDPQAVAARDRRNAYRDQHLGQWREHFDKKA